MPKPTKKKIKRFINDATTDNTLVLRAARDSDVCPICLAKGKVRHRPDEKMLLHYQKKHPRDKIPDKFYKGPRDMHGMPIPEYSGPFPVGTRVKIVGYEDSPKLCPECGKERTPVSAMRRHYDKKHKSKPYPDKPKFSFHREVVAEIEDGYDVEPIKGVVFGVTPAGYGGPRVPATIHVRLDKPIDIHASGRGPLSKRQVYYSRAAMSCDERELKRLVKK